MSRHLPESPNLKHLKKQAKDLLQELQRQSPALKLADAQRMVAREYGFASWPKLEERGKNTVQADGVEYEQDNGYAMMARWRGSHALETRANKAGQIVGWGTYEVSADGKTLTVSGDEQVIVLDRKSTKGV